MLTSLLSFRFREISNLYTGKGCSPPHWAVYSNGGTNLLQLNYSKKIDHVIKVWILQYFVNLPTSKKAKSPL